MKTVENNKDALILQFINEARNDHTFLEVDQWIVNVNLNIYMQWRKMLMFIYYPIYTSFEQYDIMNNRHPHMWYPKAREKKRNVYLHVGPTNSGKTYNALRRLEASSSGTILIYPVILKELTFTMVAQNCHQISQVCTVDL